MASSIHSRLPELVRALYGLAREAGIPVSNRAVRDTFFRKKTAKNLLLEMIYVLIENGLLDDRQHRSPRRCVCSSRAKCPDPAETTECLPQPAFASGPNPPTVALDSQPGPELETATLASKLPELQEKPVAETEKLRAAAAPQLPPKPQAVPPAPPATAHSQAPSLSKSEADEPLAEAAKRQRAQESPQHATAIRIRLQLAPGSVGKPYSRQLEVPDLSNFHEIKARGLEEIGLSISPSGLILGLPTVAGDHPASINAFADRGEPGDRVAVEIAAQITINPDPKSLWKNLEPPADAHYPKPHDFALRVPDEPFPILGASKRGRSHAHEAKFRDDDLGALFLPEGEWHVAAVADGAGSAEFSRLGSKIAVTTSLRILEESLPRVNEEEFLGAVARLQADREDVGGKRIVRDIVYETLVHSAHEAAKALNAKAEEDGISVKQLSTTLILGVARRVPGGVFFASFSIGDGGAGVFRLDPLYVKPMTVPDSGEFAGQTRFLALTEFQPEVSSRIRIDIQSEFSAFILMTDGVTDAKLPTDKAFADHGKWKELWTDLTGAVDFRRDNPEAEAQLLEWLDFWSPGNHDDRTIAVICP